MEPRLKKSHRLIRLISNHKSAPCLPAEPLLAFHRISRAQSYKDKSTLLTPQKNYKFRKRYRNAFPVYGGKTTARVVVRIAAIQYPTLQRRICRHHNQTTAREEYATPRLEVHFIKPCQVMRTEAKREVRKWRGCMGSTSLIILNLSYWMRAKMMNGKYYAHTKPGACVEEWQPLEAHLLNVAKLACSFASDFNAGKWAYYTGFWHDLGKSSDEFQAKLIASNDSDEHIETKPGRVDHSTAGAQHAYKVLKDVGKILAYAIAGHHAGIPDGKSNDGACLVKRLEKKIPAYDSLTELISVGNLSSKDLLRKFDKNRFGFQISFFIRMLYSCLVDADFLDTEHFIDEAKSQRRNGYARLKTLQDKLSVHLDRFTNEVTPSSINDYRKQILKACIEAAG